MMSGMRKPSPISISSPRETTASPPAASSCSARKTAAALLLTAMPGAPSSRSSSAGDVDVALAAASGGEVVLEVGVSRHNGKRAQRRASQIGVQHDAGGVDDAAQRRPLKAARAPLDACDRRQAPRNRLPESPRAPHRARAGPRRPPAHAESAREACASSFEHLMDGRQFAEFFAYRSRIRWYALVCKGCNRLN